MLCTLLRFVFVVFGRFKIAPAVVENDFIPRVNCFGCTHVCRPVWKHLAHELGVRCCFGFTSVGETYYASLALSVDDVFANLQPVCVVVIIRSPVACLVLLHRDFLTSVLPNDVVFGKIM